MALKCLVIFFDKHDNVLYETTFIVAGRRQLPGMLLKKVKQVEHAPWVPEATRFEAYFDDGENGSGGIPKLRQTMSRLRDPGFIDWLRTQDITRTEITYLGFIVEGLSPRDISQKVCRSWHTVRTHLKNIHAKLHVRNRRELRDMVLGIARCCGFNFFFSLA
jgi:DNA-binding CsgD family transcriptional regulator